MNGSILFALAAAALALETSPEGNQAIATAKDFAVADSAVEDCFWKGGMGGGWGGMGGGNGGGASEYTTATFESTSLFTTEIDYTSTQILTVPGSTYFVTVRPTPVVTNVPVTTTYTSVVNNANAFANFFHPYHYE